MGCLSKSRDIQNTNSVILTQKIEAYLMMSHQPKLIVHGGAWNIPHSYHAAHLAGVQQAVEAVYPQLLDGTLWGRRGIS